MILIKLLKQYIKEFDDDANLLIVDTTNDTALEILNVFKNLDTENLEIQVITNDKS